MTDDCLITSVFGDWPIDVKGERNVYNREALWHRRRS
jgi:hypothetical protein